jgi:hypothetical protein
MALISKKIYHIEVNYFRYEITWQNMQEKYLTYVCVSDLNIRPERTRPLGGNEA